MGSIWKVLHLLDLVPWAGTHTLVQEMGMLITTIIDRPICTGKYMYCLSLHNTTAQLQLQGFA